MITRESVGLYVYECLERKSSYIDLIAIVSARKAKRRAQLTTMRTTVAYRGTKLFFWLDSKYTHHTLTLSRRILLRSMQSAMF